jgi:LemA protein
VKVLFYIRANNEMVKGGDLIQLYKTGECLIKNGVDVDYGSDPNKNLNDYDIVHIFNSPRFYETKKFFDNAKKYKKPVAFSTIYWPKDELAIGAANNKTVIMVRDVLGVETAKKYMDHEKETLTAVVIARNDASAALGILKNDPLDKMAISKMSEAESKLNQTMLSFKAVAESYPQLNADKTMLNLMDELANTENRVAFNRQNYNDVVMKYNTSLEMFPNMIFAGLFRFKSATSWSIQNERERESVQVKF